MQRGDMINISSGLVKLWDIWKPSGSLFIRLIKNALSSLLTAWCLKTY